MLPQISFRRKFFLPIFISVFIIAEPSECKEPVLFIPLNLGQKTFYENNITDRFILGISYFNALREKRNALEGRLEYRSSVSLLNVKPFTGITFTSAGAFYGMAGIYSDINLSDNIIFTPSFAAGYFNKGTGHDLAYELEFRTQLELSYTLQNNSRIGFCFYHISNGNLGRSNPGAESFSFIYSIPIN